MTRIGLHPKVGLDLSGATRYYRREAGRDVAERFIAEFWRCAEFLLEHPESASAFGPEGVRRKVLQGFPFTIHYVLDQEQVYILSLAHQRRAPEHILERL